MSRATMVPTAPIPRPPTLAAAIERHAREQEQAIAVDDGDEAISFGDLVRRAAPLAERLRALPDPEAPVGILLPMSARYIVAITAALLAGRTYVPMDDQFPAKRNARIIDHAGMGALIVEEGAEPPNAAGIARIPMPDREIASGPLPPPAPRQGNYINAIFYTSGSTGEPKGVCQDEQGLIEDICAYIDAIALSPDDRVSLFASPSISVSNRDIYPALVAGARLCIVDFRRLGARQAMAALMRHRLTIFRAVPGMFRLVFGQESPVADALAPSIRLVRINGERVLPSDVELFKARFARGTKLALDIGSTETKVYAAWIADHDSHFSGSIVPVGRAPPGQFLHLIGPSGEPVPHGELGEVVVTSRTMSVSYWRDPELTRARFVPSSRYPGFTEFRTGDIGRIRPDGLFEHIGRADRQCKVQGNTVHPGEIEGVIGACPGVEEVWVVPRQTEAGVRLIAYVLGAATEAAIRDWCRERLAAATRPAEIVIGEALPRLETGKIDLAGLARFDSERAAREADDSGSAPREDAISAAVERVWIATFDRGAFVRDRSFEEAGGDSLKAMGMLLSLEQMLGKALPADLIDASTRPGELAARLAAGIGDTMAAPEDGRPTILLFCGLYGADTDIIRFARALRPAFDLRLVDFRDVGEEFIGPADAERFYAALEQRLGEAGMPKRLWILGYSFGARIAAEAARRLDAQGVTVEFLCLLDGPTEAVIAERNRRRETRVKRSFAVRAAEEGGMWPYLTTRASAKLAHKLIARERFAATRQLVTFLSRVGLRDAAKNVTRVALARSRTRAFAGLPGGPVNMSATVVVSTEGNENAAVAADLGWGALCDRVELIPIAGTHEDVIAERGVAVVRALLLDAEKRSIEVTAS